MSVFEISAAQTELETYIPDAIKQTLRDNWLPRIDPATSHETPLVRADIGRALGRLRLDNRPGVGLDERSLPDIHWCDVPAGAFLMGGDSQTYYAVASQEVDVPAFSIAKYPITYTQYEAFFAAGGYNEPRYWTKAGWQWRGEHRQPDKWADYRWHISNHPVVGLTWYEAHAFTRWLSEQLGAEVRLPTEAEWEKAARGTDGRLFAHGNTNDPNCLNNRTAGIMRTSAVGLFPAGVYGACDLCGNVWEYTLSPWGLGEQYQPHTAADLDPEAAGVRLVVRGGAWDDEPHLTRATTRLFVEKNTTFVNRGFRVVMVES